MRQLTFQELNKKLMQCNQQHLLQFWDELNAEQRAILISQIERIDFALIDELAKSHVLNKPEVKIPDDLLPADYFSVLPSNDKQKKLYSDAEKLGKKLISESKVAAFTVAGGQGTRLGYDGPKGTYPITPVKGKSLFQYFAESIKRYSVKYNNCTIPWYIMTSEMNHDETISFFEHNNYFGLCKENVMFFIQGVMPALDYSGKILMESKFTISLSPDGHGGSLKALMSSGALDDMQKRNIEHLSYFQVDNPLVTIMNPLFIGLHSIENSEMSSIMLAKTGPGEKLGNFCVSNGSLMIIEYSDMPSHLAEKKNCDGGLTFIAGSPAIHILSRKFIERLTSDGKIALPWHRADKKVPHIDANGVHIEPADVNAVKLETFIFDALPLAKKTIILEADRKDEFAPTKNKTGIDSVESCRKMMVERDCRRVEHFIKTPIPKDLDGFFECELELSPISFVDNEDAAVNSSKLDGIKIIKGGKIYIE